MKLIPIAFLAVLVAGSLSSCTGGDEGDKATSTKYEATATTSGVVSPSDLPDIPKIKKVRGIIADTTITNTGTTRLTDVGVDDPMLTDAGIDVSCPRDVLRAGQSMVCESDPYAITVADVDAGGVRNVATATGTTPGGDPVTSHDSTATVTTQTEPGSLPNTGAGFAWWMPLAGLGLLVLGFGLIAARPGRRRTA